METTELVKPEDERASVLASEQAENRVAVDFKSLGSKERRIVRRDWMREYSERMTRLGLPYRRLQVRTLFDRAVAEGKLLVTKPRP